MNTQPNVTSPAAGFKKLGLWIAVILCVLFALSGLLAVISVIIAATSSVERTEEGHELIWTLAIFVAFTAGAVWLAYYFNRFLKGGRTQIRPRPKTNPFVCASCALEVPVIKVSINRHIGALVVMFHRSTSGHFCRTCIWDSFWKDTSTTFLLGWWGLLSFFITPIVLINNVVMYVRSLFMPAIAGDETSPRLTERDIAVIEPMRSAIAEQLASGTEIEPLSTATSKATGVTPGQAYLYIVRMTEPNIANLTIPPLPVMPGAR